MRTGVRNDATVLAAATALLFSVPTAVRAQAADSACAVYLESTDFVGPAADLARLIDLQDSTSIALFAHQRPSLGYTGDACAAPTGISDIALKLGTPPPRTGVRLLPVELLVVGNSAYPRDWNDGVLWGGRGLNTALTTGARVRWGPLSAAVAPVVTWQSNSDYDTQPSVGGRSGFANPWWSDIDRPQRFGAESFGRIDAGQSYVRIDARGFGAGVSNENIRWGPSVRNPLLLSGTAGGFAHVFLETGRPVDIWIGDLEMQMFWGRLEESDLFDEDPDNDQRALAGLLMAFHPRVFDGLMLGGGRLQALTWWPELSLSDVLLRPYRGVGDNQAGRTGDNQLITVFFRWAAAPAGLEVYGEWARDDHWEEWIGLLRNLDASQAWTLGLQRLIRRGDNALRLSAEVTHLSDALPIRFATRGVLAFYTNTSVRQGHTHRGQLLGAPVGVGSESLFIGGDYFWRAGRTSVSIERARYDDDAYNRAFSTDFGGGARDTEVSVRAGHLAALGSLAVDATLGWSIRYNRDFLGLDEIVEGTEDRFRRDDNLSLRLQVRWTQQGWRQ
jgi:hypothetical protein